MKPRLSQNNFNKLFFVEQSKYTKNIYKFFYFRSSPRGNSKFGIMDIPWQRLRNQQQGTDEEIQFDKLWLTRTLYDSRVIKDIENELKSIYSETCLAASNDRAGHTEWFSDVDITEFEEHLVNICEHNAVELLSFKNIGPYTATKRSVCPFDAPAEYDRYWFDNFWLKQVDNTTF